MDQKKDQTLLQISPLEIEPKTQKLKGRRLAIWGYGSITIEEEKLVVEKVNTTLNKLRNKKITDKIMRYTVNCILIPQIEYLITDLVLKKKTIRKIDSKIREKMYAIQSIPNCNNSQHFGI